MAVSSSGTVASTPTRWSDEGMCLKYRPTGGPKIEISSPWIVTAENKMMGVAQLLVMWNWLGEEKDKIPVRLDQLFAKRLIMIRRNLFLGICFVF